MFISRKARKVFRKARLPAVKPACGRQAGFILIVVRAHGFPPKVGSYGPVASFCSGDTEFHGVQGESHGEKYSMKLHASGVASSFFLCETPCPRQAGVIQKSSQRLSSDACASSDSLTLVYKP